MFKKLAPLAALVAFVALTPTYAAAGDLTPLLAKIDSVGKRVADATANLGERPGQCPMKAKAFKALAKDADGLYTEVMASQPTKKAEKALFAIMVNVDAIRVAMDAKNCS